MKTTSAKVLIRGVGCFSALFRSVTTVIFEFFSEQKKEENFLRALFPLDDGLQKKVLLFAVCCCGVLSFRVSVVV